MALRTPSRRVAAPVVFAWRAQVPHALRPSASGTMVGLRPASSPQTRSLRWRPADSSPGALMFPGFGLSSRSQWLHPRRLPSRLTRRSSRRRISASLKLAGMRTILAPNCRVRRGLTQALGGEKHSVVVLLAAAVLWLRSAWLFGQALGSLPLRPSSSGALKRHTRCGPRLRKRWSAYGWDVRPRRVHFGDGRRRVRLARFGIWASAFRPVRHGFTLAGFLRA